MYKLFISIILFCLLFALGIRLAQNKMLWNDELYSQVNSIEKLSYVEILQGKITEGNNSPLFYLLQKGLCDVTGYRLPFVWKGEWGIAEPKGQVILRLGSNFFMALAVAAIFYVFAMEYSFLAGVYAFLTALSTEALIGYWAEARPYALWVCLTTFQALYFLKFLRTKTQQDHIWRNLGIVHVLLSLTSVFGTVQAFIAAMILFGFYRRNLKQYIVMLFVPLFFGFFYFFHAQHYVFGLPPDPLSLITANIPPDRILLLLSCGMIVVGYYFWRRTLTGTDVWGRFAAFAGLMVLSALGIMQCLSWTADPGWQPFVISNRYFIFLAPVGIVATVVISLELLKLFHGHLWMRMNMIIILVGFLAMRMLRVLSQWFSATGIC